MWVCVSFTNSVLIRISLQPQWFTRMSCEPSTSTGQSDFWTPCPVKTVSSFLVICSAFCHVLVYKWPHWKKRHSPRLLFLHDTGRWPHAVGKDSEYLRQQKTREEELEQSGRVKLLQGMFHRQIEEVANKSYQWLHIVQLIGSTEVLIMAQEQALSTRPTKAGIYHTRQNPRCRLCKDADRMQNAGREGKHGTPWHAGRQGTHGEPQPGG